MLQRSEIRLHFDSFFHFLASFYDTLLSSITETLATSPIYLDHTISNVDKILRLVAAETSEF